MSHGHSPEAAFQTEDPEDPELAKKYGRPVRIPIKGPLHPEIQYTIINQKNFTTTHKDFFNRWYQIENGSMEEAEYRVTSEAARNKRLKDAELNDPLANGLYRLTKNGLPMRPAHSDNDSPFMEAVTEAGAQDADGNYDIGDDSKQIGRGGPVGNSAARIAEQSAPIVIAKLARDDALENDTSLEEAKAIGTSAYQEEEKFRAFNSPDSTSTPEPTPERQLTKSESVKKFMSKIGRSISVGSKTVVLATTHSGHASGHVIGEATSRVNNTYQDLRERAGGIIADPTHDPAVLREAVEGLLFQPNQNTNRPAYEARMQEMSDRVQEAQDRKDLAKLGRIQLKAIALDKKYDRNQAKKAENNEKLRLKDQARNVKELKSELNKEVKERNRRIRNDDRSAAKVENDKKVHETLKSLRAYLASKHPGDPRYID